MWIRRITLHNWSNYEHTVLEFPRPDDRRGVVLIGAENGVGKTRLLEAVTLCLFGQQGVQHLTRAQPLSYPEFLNSAFRQHANELKASVKMDIDGDDGHPLAIERIWEFGGNQQYQKDVLHIEENGCPVSPPALEEEQDFQRGFIAQRFLPCPLAPFFFFDSAQVRRLADRNRDQQVRDGVGGILGVPLLRELINDLNNYAGKRRKETGKIGDVSLDALQGEMTVLDRKNKEVQEKIAGLNEDISKTEKEQMSLISELQNIGGNDVATVGALHEESGNKKKERRDCTDQLEKILTGDFALALTGSDLIDSTVGRLNAEIARGEWEHGREIGGQKFSQFLDNFAESQLQLNPPLSSDQDAQLRKKMRAAWDGIWHPMPKNCASEYWHTFLNADELTEASVHLDRLRNESIGKIRSLRMRVIELDKDIRALDSRIAHVAGGNPDAAKQLQERMKKCQESIRVLNDEKSQQERICLATESDLNTKRQEFARLSKAIEYSQPRLRQANIANAYAQTVDEIIRRAYPKHINDIAETMTSAYLAMAKENIVSKIEIGEDCSVKMLTHDNHDLREVNPLSQGENQIFTLSLIAAIVAVSKNRFPFIIDTPLGNLDTDHRRKFLQYFSSSMDNQVILLSTNEEVRKEELALLRPRLAKKLHITKQSHEGSVRNVVKPGYFPEVEQ